ncbi:MAG: galactose oxidase early set domain-containing protein [Planctomycetota bacterium]
MFVDRSLLARFVGVALVGGACLAQGKWQPPVELGISCTTPCCPTTFATSEDEIVHLNLIPVGEHAGSLLIWTRCDLGQLPGDKYKSYIWSPSAGTVRTVDWPALMDSGPFCAGHSWVLDPIDTDVNGDPKVKLLVAGGREDTTPPSGTLEVMAFDPYAAAWDLTTYPDLTSPPVAGLSGYYYPSVIALPESGPGTRYGAWSVGGSTRASNVPSDCDNDPPVLTENWFEMTADPSTSTRSWSAKGPIFDGPDVYRWHQYPRLFVLSSGEVLHAGHAVTCESPPACPGSLFDVNYGVALLTPNTTLCDLGFGQRPTHLMNSLATQPIQPIDPNDPAHPNAASLRPVNEQATVGHALANQHWLAALTAGRNVGSWLYCNGAILHTLNTTDSPKHQAPGSTTNWDLDRVLITGGIYKHFPKATSPTDANAWGIQSCLEYDAVLKQWRAKSPPLRPRALGSSFVILPTGKLFLVGGLQKNIDTIDSPNTIPDVFDPQGPLDLGTWSAQPERYKTAAGEFYPRGYHSAAILLPNGSVALTGGREFARSSNGGLDAYLNGNDVAEIFLPEYMSLLSARPELATVPAAITYPSAAHWNEFLVESRDAAEVSHAALIGVGSVTHHFDYGQRLVELPVRTTTMPKELLVTPPPNDAIAPPGWYMLFLINQNGLPSQGTFVRVDYP